MRGIDSAAFDVRCHRSHPSATAAVAVLGGVEELKSLEKDPIAQDVLFKVRTGDEEDGFSQGDYPTVSRFVPG